MAWLKHSFAPVISRNISPDKWVTKNSKQNNIIVASNNGLLGQYHPDQYLLSHATIISSVMVEEDCPYYIVPETSVYVNNNGDSWENELLMATYKTFIGGHNYLEHVQIEHLSKGKIIDAAIRLIPIATSFESSNKKDVYVYYVDILVATERKHTDICNKIMSGELNSMSMGASVAYTTCSKCGNKAKDETELCPDIRYAKLNTFLDKDNKKRIIAELCGSFEDGVESNRFFEASWVHKPAFEGASIRNVVNKAYLDLNPSKTYSPFYSFNNPIQSTLLDSFLKSASIKIALPESEESTPEEQKDNTENMGEDIPVKDPLTEAIENKIEDVLEKKLDEKVGEPYVKEEDVPKTEFNEDLKLDNSLVHATLEKISRKTLLDFIKENKDKISYDYITWKKIWAGSKLISKSIKDLDIFGYSLSDKINILKIVRASNNRILYDVYVGNNLNDSLKLNKKAFINKIEEDNNVKLSSDQRYALLSDLKLLLSF